MSTFTEMKTVTFHTLQCYLCCVDFAMEEAHYQKRLEDGRVFYCPNGHDQQFTESTVKKLAETEEQLRRAQSLLSLERDQRAAAEASLGKLKERVSSGVCPCCKRTVKQMARHMKTKHPHWPRQAPGV